MFKKFLFGIFWISIVSVISAGIFYYSSSKTINKETVVFEIPKGTTSYQIATLLEEKNIIKNDIVFKIHLKLNKKHQYFQAGRYSIPNGQPLDTLIQRFASGDTIPIETVKITIPEGYTLEQIATVFEKNLSFSKEEFLATASHWNKEYWFLEGIPTDQHKLDGFLFPDTYEFPKDITAEKAISMMLDNTEKKLEPYKNELLSHHLSVREIITLASLVEKEARHDKDRPKIAGVIYNRLNKNMLLQIDATVLAVVGHKDIVTYKDLKVDSPYNTYKYKGLPPSPIAMPGMASILAAIHPEKHNYLYYVADRKTGYHHFAETYEKHNENINKYWKKK